MRLNDLRKAHDENPDQLYATCDWQMVKPVAPVASDWYWEYQLDAHGSRMLDKDKQYKGKWLRVAESGTDPWSKCGNTKKPPRTGVLVDYYAYDENGVQGEHMGRTIVKVKDIGGTWGEFLVLHADQVTERGLARKARDEANAWQKEAAQRLAAIGIAWPIGDIQTRERGDRGFYSTSLNSHANLNTRETWNFERKSKEEIRPEGYVLPRWYPILDVTAANPEDVEYLFQVLEAGAKALAQKAARRTKRTAAKQ